MQRAVFGILGVLVLFLAAANVRLRDRVGVLEEQLADAKKPVPRPANAPAEAPAPPAAAAPSPRWNLLDSKDTRLEAPVTFQSTAPKKVALGTTMTLDGTAWGATPQQGAEPEPLTPAGRRHGFLGIQGEDVPGGGVKINGVIPNSVASAAGLQPGDVIVEVNGVKVDSLASLTTQIRSAGEGAPASLKIRRNGVEFYQGVQLSANAP